MWDLFQQSYEFVWWVGGEPWLMVGRIRLYLDVWEGVTGGRGVVYVGCMGYLKGWGVGWKVWWVWHIVVWVENGGICLLSCNIVVFCLTLLRLCSVGEFHHYSLFKHDENRLRDHVLMKHYKLRIDKMYIISNVELKFTLFTRTKMFQLITDNLKGVLGIRSYVLMLCVYISRTRFPSSRAIKDVLSRDIPIFISYIFATPIYFTFVSRRFFSSFSPVGGDDPYFPVPLHYIKMSLFSSSLTYQLKYLIKHEGVWFSLSWVNCQRNIVMSVKKNSSRYSKKRKGFLCRKKRGKINWK